MNKKTLLITLIVFLVVLGVAAALYPKLSAGIQPQQLATMPTETPETTEAPSETTEATEATEAKEPDPVPAPDFTALDWEGNEVKLSDYFGKPIVLNFWAHWCGPCQMEMPEFNAVYEELGGEVTFLMLHVGPEVEEGKNKVTDGGYTFPVIFDAEHEVANTYGITAFPTSLFLDAEGNLKAYYIGVLDKETLMRGVDMIYTPEEETTP